MDKIFIDSLTKDQTSVNRVKRQLLSGLPLFIEEREGYIQVTRKPPSGRPLDNALLAVAYKNAVYDYVDISCLQPQEYRLLERLGINIAVRLPYATFGGFLSCFKGIVLEHVFEGFFPLYFEHQGMLQLPSDSLVIYFDKPYFSDISFIDANVRPWQFTGAMPADVKRQIMSIYNSKRVVFVCTGNSCRSVMAEYLLKDILRKSPSESLNDIEVFSCGTMVIDGVGGAMNTVIDLLAKDGIDATGHVRRGLKEYLVLGADLIFVMENMHEDIILKYFPFLKNRVYLLGEFSKLNNADPQIMDPIGGSWEVYEHTYAVIKEAVLNVFNMLEKMKEQK